MELLERRRKAWREAFLVEYYNESAWPWIVGMSYKAVRTERHKLVHWIHKEGVDELYDLERDPYEITNLIGDPVYGPVRRELMEELRGLVAESVGFVAAATTLGDRARVSECS